MARASQASSTLLLFVVTLLCAGVLFWIPRPIAPPEVPPLVLPEGAVREAIAADAAAAAKAPRTEAAQRLDRMWLELGRVEHDGDERLPARRKRRVEARAVYDDIVEESGEPAALALRALAAQRLEDALALKLKPELARDVMGDFALLLEGEGCAENGELIAPMFVVRVLYKARWNIAHELPPDHRLTPIELRAYYGWQALHVPRLPAQQRLLALVQYRKHGGTRADEASGILLAKAGEAEAAEQLLQRAYGSSGSLRLRNAARGQDLTP